MADVRMLKRDVISEVFAVSEKYFDLHPPDSGRSAGAAWYSAETHGVFLRLAEHILNNDQNYFRLFSAKYVARLVRDVVADALRRGDLTNVEPMVDGLFSRVNNTDQKKRCYVPISEVELVGRLEVGPFNLQLMDDEATEGAIRLVQLAIGRTTNSTKEKGLAKRLIRRDIDKTLRGQLCFLYEGDGDTDRVEQEASRSLPTLFDLLRYAVPADLAGRIKRKNIVIGFPVEGRPGAHQRYIVPLGKSDARYGGSWSPTGKLNVDDEQLRIMERLGVFKIADALKRTQTEFESDVLNAIHWFGESQTQPTSDRELVDLIIAAESIVAREPGKSHGVTQRLCEAVAVLLETDQAEREELFAFMKSTCEVRGNVVHQGLTGTDQNNRLRHVVQEFIAAVISRTGDFQTRFELLAWIAGQETGLVKRGENRKALKNQQSIQASSPPGA